MQFLKQKQQRKKTSKEFKNSSTNNVSLKNVCIIMRWISLVNIFIINHYIDKPNRVEMCIYTVTDKG